MLDPNLSAVANGGREWRDAWRKADSVARSEARSAVDEGRVVPRVEFAALAAGLATREHNQLRFVSRAGGVAVAIFLLSGVVALGPRDALDLAAEGIGGALLGVGWILVFARKAKRAAIARSENIQLMERASQEQLIDEPPRRSVREVHREELAVGILVSVGFGVWVGFYMRSEGMQTLGAIAFGVVFMLGTLLVFLAGAWFYLRRRRRQSM